MTLHRVARAIYNDERALISTGGVSRVIPDWEPLIIPELDFIDVELPHSYVYFIIQYNGPPMSARIKITNIQGTQIRYLEIDINANLRIDVEFPCEVCTFSFSEVHFLYFFIIYFKILNC